MTRARNKIHLGLIFGGRSGEHEISLRSARCVVDAIDRDRYQLTLIGIDRSGQWLVLEAADFRRLTDARLPALTGTGRKVFLPPTPTAGALLDPEHPNTPMEPLDVIFPILHGPYGEDGTIQGLLELADIAYVGAGVLGSAVGMDKDVQKRLLQAAGLPVVPFVTATRSQWSEEPASVRGRAAALGLPLFVKPANLGSSVGITKAKTLGALDPAAAVAFQYDNKIVIEKGVDAREIECAVLGNDLPQASIPGEIRPAAEFYSYEAKYVDEHGANLMIPAPLTETETAQVRTLAVRAFQVLECAGMARVDFFLDRASRAWYVNELNTIPGFTTISMYPKMWEATGVPYRELIDRLITLALERHAQRTRLKKSYTPQPGPPG